MGFENGLPSEQGKQESNSKVEWVGNPVRPEIAAIGVEKSAEKVQKKVKRRFRERTESSAALEDKVNILVVGGSWALSV